jgi:soluble lytic murein transglycosylase-like protein
MSREWRTWLLGFIAGSVLASYVTLSCTGAGAQSVPGSAVGDLIDHYAAVNGVPAWRARAIAWCESRYLNLPNRQGSGASGVFQFMPATWSWAAPRAGWGGHSVWDVEANVAVALWLMGRGEWAHWRACW